MATVNAASLRERLDDCRVRFDDIRRRGEAGADTLALINALFLLLDILVAVFLERATPKTSANSSLPPSQTDGDGTARRAGGDTNGKGAQPNRQTGGNMRRTTVEETATVEACGTCGADLSGVDATDRERRVLYDIVFETVERRVDAEIKDCPACRARTRGRFPDGMPGPLQYGPGLQAFTVNLLIAQMLSLNRAVALIHATCGLKLSEATCLGYVRRLHDALGPWEEAATAMLLEMPVLNADETSLRVDGRNHWIHVCSGGDITVKRLHRRRGGEAIDDIGIIPRHRGVIVHDCWKAYLTYTNCKHQLCGRHLLRELQAVTDSNGWPWAGRMRKLLLIARRQVMRRPDRRLSMRHYRVIARCYGEILERGRREMPAIPKRERGHRGPVAKSDAHNLLERLAAHRGNVLRFTRRADTPFSNNRAERDIRMAKVKQKVSGCFRTVAFAEAYCRISSYLQTMTARGYNPLVAITIALQEKAVDCLYEGS